MIGVLDCCKTLKLFFVEISVHCWMIFFDEVGGVNDRYCSDEDL
jgi:hypothetical protein